MGPPESSNLKAAVSALNDKNLVELLCSVKFLVIKEGTGR